MTYGAAPANVTIMTPTTVTVRRARRDDCPEILAIYNDAVRTTTASYDFEPRSLDHRFAWFDAHEKQDYAVFVAEDQGRIIGWSSLSAYHDRMGYRFTAENSIYVASDRRGQGLGSQLLAPLLEAARARGLRTVIAVIDASNTASIRLHARFGFIPCGYFRQVGHKFDRWLDVLYMQWMA